jgi:hypothetical protein
MWACSPSILQGIFCMWACSPHHYANPKGFDTYWHGHLHYIIMSPPSFQEKVSSQKCKLRTMVMVSIHTIMFTTSSCQPPTNVFTSLGLNIKKREGGRLPQSRMKAPLLTCNVVSFQEKVTSQKSQPVNPAIVELGILDLSPTTQCDLFTSSPWSCMRSHPMSHQGDECQQWKDQNMKVVIRISNPN